MNGWRIRWTRPSTIRQRKTVECLCFNCFPSSFSLTKRVPFGNSHILRTWWEKKQFWSNNSVLSFTVLPIYLKVWRWGSSVPDLLRFPCDVLSRSKLIKVASSFESQRNVCFEKREQGISDTSDALVNNLIQTHYLFPQTHSSYNKSSINT